MDDHFSKLRSAVIAVGAVLCAGLLLPSPGIAAPVESNVVPEQIAECDQAANCAQPPAACVAEMTIRRLGRKTLHVNVSVSAVRLEDRILSISGTSEVWPTTGGPPRFTSQYSGEPNSFVWSSATLHIVPNANIGWHGVFLYYAVTTAGPCYGEVRAELAPM